MKNSFVYSLKNKFKKKNRKNLRCIIVKYCGYVLSYAHIPYAI